jgi:glucokinase
MSNSAFPNAQNQGAGSIPVYESGLAYKNITTAQSAAVKASPGTLGAVTVNTAGAGSTLVLYDSLSATGTKIATISTAAQADLPFNCVTTIGLFAVTLGGTAADITITYM